MLLWTLLCGLCPVVGTCIHSHYHWHFFPRNSILANAHVNRSCVEFQEFTLSICFWANSLLSLYHWISNQFLPYAVDGTLELTSLRSWCWFALCHPLYSLPLSQPPYCKLFASSSSHPTPDRVQFKHSIMYSSNVHKPFTQNCVVGHDFLLTVLVDTSWKNNNCTLKTRLDITVETYCFHLLLSDCCLVVLVERVGGEKCSVCDWNPVIWVDTCETCRNFDSVQFGCGFGVRGGSACQLRLSLRGSLDCFSFAVVEIYQCQLFQREFGRLVESDSRTDFVNLFSPDVLCANVCWRFLWNFFSFLFSSSFFLFSPSTSTQACRFCVYRYHRLLFQAVSTCMALRRIKASNIPAGTVASGTVCAPPCSVTGRSAKATTIWCAACVSNGFTAETDTTNISCAFIVSRHRSVWWTCRAKRNLGFTGTGKARNRAANLEFP